jgi:subtilisin-like proprotein convertase family protein
MALACCCALSVSAQSSVFQLTSGDDMLSTTVDLDQLRGQLELSPKEFSGTKSNVHLSLPLPDGNFADFTAYDSDLLPAHKELGSYKVAGLWGGGRIAISPAGMSGVLRGPNGYYIIEPLNDGTDNYQIIEYGDFMAILGEEQGPLACGFDADNMPDYAGMEIEEAMLEAGANAGARRVEKAGNEARELRVYDLIITCTGEFGQAQGGTVAGVLAAFNLATSTINAIFENEIGIRMNLVEVPGLIYLDPATDPFTDATLGSGLLGQVIGAFNENNVSLNAYDLGHILTVRCSDVGGVVSGAACNNGGKTRGVTCVGGSIVGAALRIMAHEVAHQFSVSHSWNNCPGSEGQRAGGTAFEPGSGTTIMSYAGSCGAQNVGGDGAYYHIGSIEQFLRFTRETGAEACATVIETSNFTPNVDFIYEDGFTIPANTPFRLAGTATDANNDNLTYNWEQFDLGPASDIRAPSGTTPLFISRPPSEEGNVRFFPNLGRIIRGQLNSPQEFLPTYTRRLTFRLTARDNNLESGGVDWKEIVFRADSSAGPFIVDNPADGEWNVGDYQQITWDVAKTDQAPINCKRVNILLSTDGGDTFDVVLATNAPNNGIAFVTVPAAALTDEARIMVEAADNVFLNVNLQDFNIVPSVDTGFTLQTSILFDEVCLPDVVDIELATGSILGFSEAIALSVDEASLPAGASATITNAQLIPGTSTTLRVDLSEVRFGGLLEVTVIATAEGQDTARRTILLEVTDNDYADLATISPAEGTSGIILATAFGWTDAINADTYEIEIATSPTFSEANLFERAEGINTNSYLPEEFFEPNTLYFWRIRPTNICGAGDWTMTNSFRTVNSACRSISSTDTPIGLAGNGPAFSRESILFIEQSGAINDLNIPNANIRYNFASKVTISLTSPAGTTVVLYREKCFSSNLVNLGFDDDAPLPVSCPANDRRVFIPEGSLADFNGEDTFGEWKLRVSISETGGSAGSIQGWEIEFCADVSAVAPQSINNIATECPPGERSVVLQERLEVTSAAFNTGEVVYTVTNLPTAGRMILHGNEIGVGSTFRQADINGRGLFYENTDPTATTDAFRFVVTTPDGGYLPVTSHDIMIFEGAVVSTNNVSEIDAGLQVFPNPTAGDLALRWSVAINRPLDLQLFDLNGRLLRTQTVGGAVKAASLDITDLPAGIYLLRVDGAVRRVVKR